MPTDPECSESTTHTVRTEPCGCGRCIDCEFGNGRKTIVETTTVRLDDNSSRPRSAMFYIEQGHREAGAKAERARIVAIIDDELEAMAEHGAWRSHQKVRDLRKRITGREGEPQARAASDAHYWRAKGQEFGGDE